MEVPCIELNDGASIPQLGLGVFQMSDEEAAQAIPWAVEAGYRHIDTAAIYRNEGGVGRGIKQCSKSRDKLWITSKVWNESIRKGETRKAVEESLSRLDVDHLDLCLLHWPVEGRLAAWKDLEALHAEGVCRSIGVSNFMPEHLEELVTGASVVPSVNQIELHPYLQQRDVQASCKKAGIKIQCWSPLMQGHFLKEPLFAKIAEEVGRTSAQVVLRWAVQQDFIVIPKSSKQKRIAENGAVFDFELNETQMAAIGHLEQERRFGPDPRNFSF